MLLPKVQFSITVCAAVACSVLAAATAHAEAPGTPSRGAQTAIGPSFANLPMSFERNQGQFDSSVSFAARGRGCTMFLRPSEATLILRRLEAAAGGKANSPGMRRGKGFTRHAQKVSESVLRLSLVGANPHAQLEGVDQLPGVVNYFLGNDPKKWRVAIPTFTKVRCRDVYPGVDLLYYGNQQRLEYDFVVSPGADPGKITMRFDGADKVEIDGQGDLIMEIQGTQVRWRKPVAYQETAAGRNEIPSRYVLKGQLVSFEVGSYDRTRPLVIDPVLVYSTFLGGTDIDSYDYYYQIATGGVTVDTNGAVYVTGNTLSTDFPVTNAVDATANGWSDVFIAKLNNAGTALIYSTYLGGSDDDMPRGIAVDNNGNAYVVGWTYSTNFPTQNAFQSTFSDFTDAFVVKLGPAGTSLLYSSFLGNTANAGDEIGNAIAVDKAGNAYITGETDSGRNFRTRNPFQTKAGGYPQENGNFDVFVAKINTTTSGDASLVYSSWLGGSSDEYGFGIAVDSSNNVYVTGEVDYTPSSDYFPTTAGAFQQSFNAGGTNGFADAFVTKINAAGSAMVFSTFLGGDGEEWGNSIAVDAAGKAYVTGETSSYADLPTLPNGIQPTAPGYDVAFVTVFNASGAGLFYSTYLGGLAGDFGAGIAVDNFGQIYVAGETSSYDFPVTIGCDQTNLGSLFRSDAFVAKINPNVPGPAGLCYASYFGGNDAESPAAVAVDAGGNWYITGYSKSTNMPTTLGVFDTTYNGGDYDAFVAKFSSPRDLSVANLVSTNAIVFGSNLVYTLYVNNNGRLSFSGVTVTDQLPTNLQFVTASTTLGLWTTNMNGLVTFNLGSVTNNVSAILTITALAATPGTITNTATVTSVETQAGQEPNTGNNVSAAITGIRGIADVTLAMSAAPTVIASSNLTYVIGVTNKGPSWPATQILITDVLPPGVGVVTGYVSQGSASNVSGVVIADIGTLAVGAGAALTLVVSTAPTATTITNTATVSTFEVDNNLANNTNSAITTVTPLADLALFSSPTGAPDPVFATSNLTYIVSVTNFGPSIANSVVVTDILPPAVSDVTPQSTLGTCTQTNGIVTCNITALATNAGAAITINCKAGGQGSVTNTASVTSAALDLNPANNSVLAVNTVIPLVDLAVSMTGLPSPALVASNLIYTIVLTNRGPSTATGVVLTDTLPANTMFAAAQAAQGGFTQGGGIVTWSLSSLSANTAATATVTVIPTLEGLLTNVASVTATTTELNPANNTATNVTTVNYNPSALYLKITLGGTNVILFWSTNASDFSLQSAATLPTSNVWNTVTNVPARVGPLFYVTNAASVPFRAYRLSKSVGGTGPYLQIALADTNVLLSWPTNAAGFSLQSASTLTTNIVWNDMTNIPVPVGPQFFVTDLISDPLKFYRLLK